MANLNRLAAVSITLNTRGFSGSTFSQMAVLYTATAQDTVPHLITDQADALTASSMLETDWAYGALGAIFGQSPGPSQVLIIPVQSAQAPADALTAAVPAANLLGGFYGFVAAPGTAAAATALAQWANANGRMFWTEDTSADATNATATDDVCSLFKAAAYDYAACFGRPSQAPESYVAAALMASRFAYQPGSENWANVPLSGVPVDGLSDGAAAIIKAKNGNTYEAVGSPNGGNSINLTFNGWMGSGERADVIRFKDWLLNDIQINVATVLSKQPKVPYTDVGISRVKSAVTASMNKGVDVGGIAPSYVDSSSGSNVLVPSYTVTAPLRSTISSELVSQRTLQTVNFTAILAGAINSAGINGTLNYGND